MCHHDPVLCKTRVCVCVGEYLHLFMTLLLTRSPPKHVKHCLPRSRTNILGWLSCNCFDTALTGVLVSCTVNDPLCGSDAARPAKADNAERCCFLCVLLCADTPAVLLICAAEAMSLTQGDVGLVHWLDVGLSFHDNVVTEVSATHPPPSKDTNTTEKHSIFNTVLGFSGIAAQK